MDDEIEIDIQDLDAYEIRELLLDQGSGKSRQTLFVAYGEKSQFSHTRMIWAIAAHRRKCETSRMTRLTCAAPIPGSLCSRVLFPRSSRPQCPSR